MEEKANKTAYRSCPEKNFQHNNWTDYCRTIIEKTSVSNFNTIEFCETKDRNAMDRKIIQLILESVQLSALSAKH